MNYQIFGSLVVRYTLDGISTTRKYTVDDATPEYTRGVQRADHFRWYVADALAPKDHMLEIQIMESSNQIFELDYITYTPSFNTLATKEPSVSSSNQVPPQSSSQASPGDIPPAPTTNSGTTPARAEGKKIGGIVGGIVGGVVVLLIVLIFLYRKRFNSGRGSIQPTRTQSTPLPHVSTSP